MTADIVIETLTLMDNI